MKPGSESILNLRPDPGFQANGYELLLRIRTSAGFYARDFNPASTDVRHLGVFLKPTYRTR